MSKYFPENVGQRGTGHAGFRRERIKEETDTLYKRFGKRSVGIMEMAEIRNELEKMATRLADFRGSL